MKTYAVITCHAGVSIDIDEINQIESVLVSIYGERNFGLIANRENLYTVNPLAIDKLFSRENLVAGAIVGKDMKHAINAAYENMMVKGAKIEYFFEMALAVNWIEGMVRESISVH